MTEPKNLSAKHQKPGDARKPQATLDRTPDKEKRPGSGREHDDSRPSDLESGRKTPPE